ncbi:hypothetical protein SUGI_0472330 [Cryptomeria japonica]|uniref:uncharacterized protein LOC131875771 n=1 Tax=Cryptomeria japonica TaxID=3369 RepID=UPI002408A503|nr:uncharacterized protein LOC131875771 [Cryptomeria japonica]GLJ24696.1 hypothetical protein SUGI_0472330 [Cryptomeria japonica]
MATGSSAVLALVTLMVLTAQTSEALVFVFSNHIQGTADSNRFYQEIGQCRAFEIMDSSTIFIWDTFQQQSTADRKNVDKVTFIVKSMDDVVYMSGDEIHLSADYVGNYGGDVKAEIRGGFLP